MKLLNRKVKVIAGGYLIEALRTTFRVTKRLTKEPNEMELTIYNLNDQQRASMQKLPLAVVLEAGYEDGTATIFSGDARYVDSGREGADWITKIQAGDGERSYRFSAFSESFKSGTSVAAVFQRAAAALGVDADAATAVVNSGVLDQFSQGASFHGRASAAIDSLLKGRGFEWSIQDGKLQVLATGKPLQNAAVLLNANSGLIGVPTHAAPAKPGTKQAFHAPIMKIKSLLQAQLAPGKLMRLESAAVSGNFRIEQVIHSGDTHGGDWFSELEAVAL